MLGILAAIVILPHAAPSEAAAQEHVQTAERFYGNQQDSAALAEIRLARAEMPSSIQARWREAFILLAVANRTKDGRVRQELLRTAQPKADSLVRIHPTSSEAWFISALALGVECAEVSPRRRLLLSKEMRQRIGRSLVLDVRNAGAWFLLGRWHETLASLGPVERGLANLLLGGMPYGVSMDSARLALENAAHLRSDDLQIHHDLVRVLIAQGMTTAARDLARRALGFPIASAGDRNNRKAIEGLLKQL